MKTLATFAVQAILSYESAPQDFFAVDVIVPTVDGINMQDLQIDVLEQIITSVAKADERPPLEELAKISLCYCNSGEWDAAQRRVFEGLTERNNGKFYFQPNQRTIVEDELMQRVSGLAFKTKAFA